MVHSSVMLQFVDRRDPQTEARLTPLILADLADPFILTREIIPNKERLLKRQRQRCIDPRRRDTPCAGVAAPA
jgi:hypothetical protein